MSMFIYGQFGIAGRIATIPNLKMIDTRLGGIQLKWHPKHDSIFGATDALLNTR